MNAVPRHEHEFEAAHGLPEALPPGEHVLWQGAPDAGLMALQAFHLRKLALYFAALLVWHAAGAGWLSALKLAPLAVLALALVGTLAWLTARTTAYTVTDRRVVMRIGIVLTVTYNLPYARIEGAALHADSHGRGSIALQLARGERIAWLHLWPHVRPWRVARTEPLLRSLPDAQAAAAILTQAWCAARALPAASAPADRGVAPAGLQAA